MAQPQECRFLQWLSFLTILALPILPIGYLIVRHGQSTEMLFSPGSLALAHQGLDCKQCHVEPWRGWHGVLREDRPIGSGMDQGCAQCHGGLLNEFSPSPGQGAVILSSRGPSRFSGKPALELRQGLVMRPQLVAPHHPRQVAHEVESCAGCHQDHQGEKGLLHVTEEQCKRCHSDLRTADGQHRFYPHLSAFDTDHPPFGWWRAGGLDDPGALRFNHQMHLHLDRKALHGLDETLRRLQSQECGFCHQPDSSGGRMAPIRYESHCSECHPLAVQIVAETSDFRLREAARSFCQEPAPHASPELVSAVLRERLRLLAQQNPTIGTDIGTSAPLRRMPGPRRAQPALRELSGWVEDQAAQVQRLLFDAPGGCRYCHTDKRVLRQQAPLPEYDPTNIPASWFPHAKFSHARHGLMECAACHEKAWTSTCTHDVLMPLKSKCVECHNTQKGSGPRARTDCLECHRYHGPDGGPTQWTSLIERE